MTRYGTQGAMCIQQKGQPFVRNGILATLPPAELAQLRPFLNPVVLRQRAVIDGAGSPIEFVNFVESGLVSLRVGPAGSAVEFAMVGFRGATGLSALLGLPHAPCESVVLVEGKALQLPAETLLRVVQARAVCREHLLRQIHVQIAYSAQTALCGLRHDLTSRLASWVCLASYHLGGHVLPVTHEDISTLLGLHRSGVTDALSRLEQLGLLRKMRGVIALSDREGLRQIACACYGEIVAAHDAARRPDGDVPARFESDGGRRQ